MSSRRVAWGTAAGVMLAAVIGGLVNELHAGWPWWGAAAIVTLLAAVLAGWLASHTSDPGDVVVEKGGVYAGRDIAGKVTTKPESADGSSGRRGSWRRLGPGAVFAGRDLTRTAQIDTGGDSTPPGGDANR